MTVTPRVVALASIALTLAVVYGLWYAFSVVLVALLNEFGWSRSTLAGAFSVFMLMHGGLSPVVGALCARARPSRVMAAGGVALSIALLGVSLVAQPWQLYLSFGVVTAAAVASCGWVPSLVHVQRSFPDRLGLAMGIASAGVGVGIFVVVPAFQALIDAFGWRAAFRAFALICLLWIVPSSLLLLREPARGAATRARDTTA
ncbi:MAG TPA: MFS transporter, partial [Burkholderiaceae bacterium]|nr:MFS transporter [Burkholderiaceae bacterium]